MNPYHYNCLGTRCDLLKFFTFILISSNHWFYLFVDTFFQFVIDGHDSQSLQWSGKLASLMVRRQARHVKGLVT